MAEGPTTIELSVQFLSLFIPSMIAVFGSYKLYRKRQNETKETLKSGIRTEIESAERLAHIASYMESNDGLPKGTAVSTSVYDGQSSELGLLDDKQRNAIIKYYSNVKIFNDMIIAAREADFNESELPDEEYDYMRWQLDRVRGTRKSALIHLNSNEIPEDTDFD